MYNKQNIHKQSGREMGLVFITVFLVLEAASILNNGYGVIGGLVTVFVTIIFPQVFFPLYRVWMRLAWVLSFLFSPIFMGVLFFTVFAPTGIILRFLNKDLLLIHTRNIDKKTFWKDKDITLEGGMTRQF